MKSISTILLFIFCLSAIAQDFSDLKFCINPGHGGHDSDDRYQPESEYWESEGNLTKGLFLRDILENWGATVVMSRTQNRTEDDLPLSQISAIANENNVDFFHSIHSNANNQQVNYALILFRGYDNNPVFDESKKMGNVMWNMLDKYNRGNCVVSEPNVRGDWSFYDWGTSGLGVLRNLEMPGVLTEGSHHDYPIEAWRLQNIQYREHEAWAFSRAYIEYYQKETYPKGVIAGIVRDPWKDTKYYFDPATNDNKEPLNNVKVRLLPDEIEYTTDEMNNGFYMFDELTHGEYRLIFEHNEYFNDTLDVSVTANETTFADLWMQFDTTMLAKVTNYLPQTTELVTAGAHINFDFTLPMNTTATQAAFSIEPPIAGQFEWGKNNKSMTFVPEIPLQKSTQYKVTLSTDAKQKWNAQTDRIYTFNFTTKDRNRLSIKDNYPKDRQTDVNTKTQLRLHFDAELNPTTLNENIVLKNDAGEIISLKNKTIDYSNNFGVYMFDPKNKLAENTTYTLFIDGEVRDIENIPVFDDISVTFTTASAPTINYTVLEGFEEKQTWTDPDDISLTYGTTPSKTMMLRYRYPIVSDMYSGRLSYVFEQENAVCAMQFINLVYYNTDNEFNGLWIYGDLSYNKIVIHLEDENSNAKTIELGVLDWAGWELLPVDLSAANLSGNVLVKYLAIEKTTEGANAGVIYIDDVATSTPASDICNPKNKTYFKAFAAPQPFTDHVDIHYSAPYNGTLNFLIFDTNGKLIYNQNQRLVQKGKNIIYLKQQFPRAGLYLCKIIFVAANDTKTEIKTIRLLKAN